jgi:hypothetical protein
MVQEIDLWPHRIKSKKSSLLAQQASADNAANRPVRASLRYLVPLRGRPARCWGGRLRDVFAQSLRIALTGFRKFGDLLCEHFVGKVAAISKSK